LTYCNGIWAENMAYDLLWYVNTIESNLPEGPLGQSCSTLALPVYPSWAWSSRWGHKLNFERINLSRNGHVAMFKAELKVLPARDQVSTRSSPGYREPVTAAVNFYQHASSSAVAIDGFVRDLVIDLTTTGGRKLQSRTYHSQDPVGGFVHNLVVDLIDTRVRRVQTSTPQDFGGGNWMRVVRDGDSGNDVGYIVLDSDPAHLQSSSSLACLASASRPRTEVPFVTIALQARGRANEFRRVELVYEKHVKIADEVSQVASVDRNRMPPVIGARTWCEVTDRNDDSDEWSGINKESTVYIGEDYVGASSSDIRESERIGNVGRGQDHSVFEEAVHVVEATRREVDRESTNDMDEDVLWGCELSPYGWRENRRRMKLTLVRTVSHAVYTE
jgi:hypothetical protein